MTTTQPTAAARRATDAIAKMLIDLAALVSPHAPDRQQARDSIATIIDRETGLAELTELARMVLDDIAAQERWASTALAARGYRINRHLRHHACTVLAKAEGRA